MRNYLPCLLLLPLIAPAQSTGKDRPGEIEVIRLHSHIPTLRLALLHEAAPGGPSTPADPASHASPASATHAPVLFLHGSSFPSELAAGFRMNGRSWMDELSAQYYDCYALDFLGYGYSDRYPEMENAQLPPRPTGQAQEIIPDIDSAVNYILRQTGSKTLHIIAHSWGGSVAALYASRFPGKVASLVLFAPIPAGHSDTKPDSIKYSYESLTPEARVAAMQQLTPAGETCRLEEEVSHRWKSEWLRSDPIATASQDSVVRFPSGPSQDIDDLGHGRSYYDPSLIRAPTLLIRGEWDSYPSNEEAGILFAKLTNTASKKYVVIEKATHVMHLEKSRHQLYTEVLNFLNTSAMPT